MDNRATEKLQENWGRKMSTFHTYHIVGCSWWRIQSEMPMQQGNVGCMYTSNYQASPSWIYNYLINGNQSSSCISDHKNPLEISGLTTFQMLQRKRKRKAEMHGLDLHASGTPFLASPGVCRSSLGHTCRQTAWQPFRGNERRTVCRISPVDGTPC